MTTLRCAHVVGVLSCLLSLLGCSNGRGSVEAAQEQTEPAGFSVSATISGLAGTGLVLQLNGANDLAVSGNGPLAFTPTLANGAAYDVTVLSQPANPDQTCTVSNGAGSVAGANVTGVAVACTGIEPGAFAVRGAVTGLTGSGLVLRNNGGDDLAIPLDGELAFPTAITTGAAYAVTVAVQPTTPAQTCSVTNGSGVMGGADVTNVVVTCATGSFTVGGTVSGLVGTGLKLQNNGGDALDIASNGPFTFATSLASGTPYNVTASAQPVSPAQTCTVSSPAGTVGDANVTNVAVSCATNVFTVGGSVTGLAGSGLVLQLNRANDREITGDGAFAFDLAVPSGTPYVVTIKKHPSRPTQVCSLANDVGVVGGANITNVSVTCQTSVYSIGGSVSGLAGDGLVLQKNGGDDLAIASSGNFTFETEQASGTAYEVKVAKEPVNPAQTCTVENPSGVVGAGDVKDVKITCATKEFSIRGAVSGLLGDRVELLNNGGDSISVEADGAFVFPTKVASGGAYAVTVKTQPTNPTQACIVDKGNGTIGAAEITNVAVTCTTSSFMVGGTVSGLAGSGLILRNNGADDVTLNSSQTSFSFPTAVASGGTYSVEIAAQPTGPAQECTIANATGVVGSSPVDDIEVSCTTTEFMVGGSVSGLAGSGLQLQNNGGPGLAIGANGAFEFPTSLTTGAQYNVSVLAQPTGPSQTCAVAQGSGTIGSADVANVAVTCTTNTYTIGGTVTGLTGIGLELQLNAAEVLAISLGAGSFSFTTLVPSGQPYEVIVVRQPDRLPFTPPQTCTIANGSGAVGGANVTDLTVTC